MSRSSLKMTVDLNQWEIISLELRPQPPTPANLVRKTDFSDHVIRKPRPPAADNDRRQKATRKKDFIHEQFVRAARHVTSHRRPQQNRPNQRNAVVITE